LAADVMENIVTSGDAAQTVLGAQVFG